MDDEARDYLARLQRLKVLKDKLEHYKKIQDRHGSEIPPHIMMEIRDTEAQIQELQNKNIEDVDRWFYNLERHVGYICQRASTSPITYNVKITLANTNPIEIITIRIGFQDQKALYAIPISPPKSGIDAHKFYLSLLGLNWYIPEGKFIIFKPEENLCISFQIDESINLIENYKHILKRIEFLIKIRVAMNYIINELIPKAWVINDFDALSISGHIRHIIETVSKKIY